MHLSFSIPSTSPEQTLELGRRLGRTIHGGVTIALTGPLGAGKTHFTQGIAKGLKIREPITSPSFLLHKTYEGRLRLHHFDFYRLTSEDDLESIGFYDFQAQDASALIVVEWAEKFPRSLEEPLIEIQITPRKDEARLLQFSGRGIQPRQWEALKHEAEKR